MLSHWLEVSGENTSYPEHCMYLRTNRTHPFVRENESGFVVSDLSDELQTLVENEMEHLCANNDGKLPVNIYRTIYHNSDE